MSARAAGVIERHRRERHVAERLDQNAAEANHQQQSPGGIAVDAENDLATGRRHRLHQHAVDMRRRRVLPGCGEHAIIGRAHGFSPGKTERDRTGLGLVRDVGGLNLERDGTSDCLRGCNGLLGRVSELSRIVAPMP